MPLERLDHGVDVFAACKQEDRRRSLRDLRADLVDERVVKMGDVIGFIQSACSASGDEPDRNPGGPKNAPTTAPVRAPSAVRLPTTSPRSSTSTYRPANVPRTTIRSCR
jgi:hypothetical protein